MLQNTNNAFDTNRLPFLPTYKKSFTTKNWYLNKVSNYHFLAEFSIKMIPITISLVFQLERTSLISHVKQLLWHSREVPYPTYSLMRTAHEISKNIFFSLMINFENFFDHSRRMNICRLPTIINYLCYTILLTKYWSQWRR